jgi:hypothetical protein
MLRAFIDDSNIGGDAPVAVLAGWMAPAKVWAPFSDAWDMVLRMSPRIEYFKWKEWRGLDGEFHGISEPSALEKLKLLVGAIAQHEPLGVASMMSNKLYQEIFHDSPDSIMRQPYFLSFYSVVVQLVEYAAVHFPGQSIDFHFDTQPGQMAAALGAWERLKETAPPEMKKVIGAVGFNDDRRTKPLQAADLNAGFMREQAEYGCFGKEPPAPPWGDTGSSIKMLHRIWTAQTFHELSRSGAFQVPARLIPSSTWGLPS